MFEVSQVLELMKVEPGSGLVQSILLFMIWWSSREIKKAIASLGTRIDISDIKNETRFVKIENRITDLESKGG